MKIDDEDNEMRDRKKGFERVNERVIFDFCESIKDEIRRYDTDECESEDYSDRKRLRFD